jgi:multidrug resistance efflux pump
VASLHALQLRQSRQLSQKGIESALDVEIMKTRLATQENVVREAELELAKLRAGSRPEEIEQGIQEVNARRADLALATASRDELRRLELGLEGREAELRLARAERDEAEARVSMRRAALEKTVVCSPVSGTVMRVFFSVGEVVRKGEPAVAVIDDSKGRWVEGYVAEDDADRVRPGQKAEVEIGIGSGHCLDAVIGQVGHSVSSGRARSRSFTQGADYGNPAPVWVRADLPESGRSIRPGTSADLLIRVR